MSKDGDSLVSVVQDAARSQKDSHPLGRSAVNQRVDLDGGKDERGRSGTFANAYTSISTESETFGGEDEACAILFETANLCRDGGTGRRSGLKIRRSQGRGGSTPPPGTTH